MSYGHARGQARENAIRKSWLDVRLENHGGDAMIAASNIIGPDA